MSTHGDFLAGRFPASHTSSRGTALHVVIRDVPTQCSAHLKHDSVRCCVQGCDLIKRFQEDEALIVTVLTLMEKDLVVQVVKDHEA